MMTMEMMVNVKFVLLFAILKATTLFVKGEDECGNLVIKNRYITAGITVRIQFSPATRFKHIVESENYRWVFENRTKRSIVYDKRMTSFDPRLSEENYTLIIQDVRVGDEGEYKLQCWYKGPAKMILIYSKSVDLKLQEPLITLTTIKPVDIVTETSEGIGTSSSKSTTRLVDNVAPSAENKLSDDTGGGATAIAGTISGVAIITVATVILVLILRKRRRLNIESSNNDEKAGFIEDNTANDYATVTDCANPQDDNCNPILVNVDPYNSIEQPLVKSDKPACENERRLNETKVVADEYSTVIPKSLRKDKRMVTKSYENISETKQDEYATIIPKSERTKREKICNKADKNDNGGKAEYASVIPKSMRKVADDSKSKHDKADKKIALDKTLNELDNSGKDMYASVETKSKKKAKGDNKCKSNKTEKKKALGTTDFAEIALKLERHRAREQWHSTPDLLNQTGNQYSNVLLSSLHDLSNDPKSQYSKPEDQRLLDIHGLDSVKSSDYKYGPAVRHEYDTPCPIERKKTILKELQYIQIDHSDTSSYRSQSTESLDIRPVQYSDIDFTKKAFVAPKRYPPPPSPRKN